VEEHVSIYVMSPDLDTAKRIARALLDQRLVACANLFPTTSIYRWDGAIQEEPEVAMLLKTRRVLFGQVEAVVRALHPHKIPCIVAIDMPVGHLPYLAWVDEETRHLAAPR
jgi:periplasmic divalent cation tolerance protein